MADNSAQNATDTIRTDDRAGSGIKTQVMLVDVGTEAGAELIGLGECLIVEATSAGLTTGATAYTAGDQLGTEMTFASMSRTAKGSVINSAILIDKSSKIASVDLFLFESTVTPASDNAANAWSDADMLKLIGVIHFTDALTSANNTVLQATNLPIVIKPAVTSIFAHMVTRTANAASFGAATDIQARLGVIRD